MDEMKAKKRLLHMPHAYTLIFMLIIFVAILTWILPSGEFERQIVDTAAGERSVAIAGTYQNVSKVDADGNSLKQGITQILMAPGKGIQAAAGVIAFVLIIGGVFQIMAKTNAMNLGIQRIVRKLGKKEVMLLPILMILFGLGGSTFGMSDELVPFYLLLMPIILALGYDSMTTFMVVFLGASIGYASSTINPFNVLIAQGIAGIQGNPQLVFRMIQWLIMMVVTILFVTLRALKVKKNPEFSITYKDDLIKRKEFTNKNMENEEFTIRHKLVIAVFVIGMIVVVNGLIRYGWYMDELSMCFLAMGILMGIVGGLKEKELAEEFIFGVKDIVFAAVLIGFCSGILVIAKDGLIIDTILNALSNSIAGANNTIFVGVMYVVQSVLTFLVPSSSGLSALTIPVMSSLCDLHGVNAEASVTVLQYANQMTNMISPVAGTTVAGLAICKISFSQWWKTIWKMFIVFTVLALVFATISASL